MLIQSENKYSLKNEEHEYACEMLIGYSKDNDLSERPTGKRETKRHIIYNCIHFFYTVI